MLATEGIVLKRMGIGEADLLYAIYTKDFGKITARAQGVRKNEAKLRGHLELLSHASVRMVAGKNGEKLIGATMLNFWENLRGRETTLRLASYVAHRIDEQCFAGERDAALWDFVYASFEALNQRDFPLNQAEGFMREFDAGFSQRLGHGDGAGEDASSPAPSGTMMAKEAQAEYSI